MTKTHFRTTCFLAMTSLALAACAESPPTTLEEPRTFEESELQSDELSRYYEYLAQAGFNNPSQLGSEKEVQACDVRAEQGSFTFNPGLTESCTWQQSEPGWVVESVSVEVKENRHDRGRWSYSVMAADGQFNMNAKEIGDKWNAAIELAAKAKDVDVEKKLKLDYEHHMERVLSLSSNKNTVYVQVTANGGLFESSAIHVVATAKLVRVQ